MVMGRAKGSSVKASHTLMLCLPASLRSIKANHRAPAPVAGIKAFPIVASSIVVVQASPIKASLIEPVP